MNAGIGGTDSLFGAARLERDLLREQPDFVIVDFSVNDKAKECFQETFEGVLRKLLSWPSEPAVMYITIQGKTPRICIIRRRPATEFLGSASGTRFMRECLRENTGGRT